MLKQPDSPLDRTVSPALISVPVPPAVAQSVVSPAIVSVPSAVLQQLLAMNSAYTALEERVHGESKRPLLGAQGVSLYH